MRTKDSNQAKIAREEQDLANVLALLPDNPVDWMMVVRLIGPIIARLAVRYALKRAKRSLSEDRVNAIGNSVAAFIGNIIKKRIGGDGLRP